MDLLGSILGSMEKPPSIGDDAKKKAKAQKEKMEKMQLEEKKAIQQFRSSIQKRIEDFLKDPAVQKLQFATMDKVHRAVVHEMAEVASLASFSFGEEELDRYVMIWKKEFAPSDDELASYKSGEPWDPQRAKEMARLREEQQRAQSSSSPADSRQKSPPPNSDYMNKYEHLIGGKETAKEAARATTANRQYGFVPTENKKDRRTIEETMADNRAKRQRTTGSGGGGTSGCAASGGNTPASSAAPSSAHTPPSGPAHPSDNNEASHN